MKPINVDSVRSLGKRLGNMRTIAKLSQDQLAEMVGCSRSFLSNIEAGYHFPRADLLARIATVLGVTTDYLCGMDGDVR